MHYRKKTGLSTTSFSSLRNLADVSWNFLLDIFFPKKCLLCKKEGAFFCASCRIKMPVDTNPLANRTFSLWRYDDETVRKALWELKYRGRRGIARELAESLYDKILETLSENEVFENPARNHEHSEQYLLVPIPIHKKRRRERGYNQSELLAKELEKLNPSLFCLETKLLFKTKATPSQVSVKDREKRLKNIKNSFSVEHQEKAAGKNIIILDDITTTGATLAEAKRLLAKAGAKTVWCVTIAH